MAATAILVANSDYSNQQPLPCCREDAHAVEALLGGTGRFGAIHVLVDRDAATLKRELRALAETLTGVDELFFYFSGHGHSENGEFYFCPRDFNDLRPNETGLSHSELIVLAREISPELFVQVVDACQAGAPMIKGDNSFLPELKGGLKKVVRIAACAESETALAGDRLSPFTEKFCRAASRQADGPIFYMDIIASLRDAYLLDAERSPFFTLQASARETFIDDPSLLEHFRSELERRWGEPPPQVNELVAVAEPPLPASLADRLATLELKLAKAGEVQPLINSLFDGLVERLSKETFDDCFDLTTTAHRDFQERATRQFVIRVLTQEKRADEFVTATMTKERRKRRSLYPSIDLAMGLRPEYDDIEHWDLELNMSLERAQLRITLTPRFASLKRIIQVVTCAPSLEHCYVFELSHAQRRTDWNSFSSEGAELTRRWYKLCWNEDPANLIGKIASELVVDARAVATSTAAQMSGET